MKCAEVGCLRDEDCAQDEKCDYSNRQCVPLCLSNPCAQGATCYPEAHKETCKCNPPLKGDGYTFCDRRKTDIVH